MDTPLWVHSNIFRDEQDKEKAKEEGIELPKAEAGVTPYIRPLTMADMRQAMEKVSC